MINVGATHMTQYHPSGWLDSCTEALDLPRSERFRAAGQADEAKTGVHMGGKGEKFGHGVW